MRVHLRRKLLDEATKPVSINVHNLVLKLRRIRVEIHAMSALIDSALERIDEPVNSGDHFPP